MRLSKLMRHAGLALCALTMAAAAPARAEWKRAESPHFIVYSRGDEGTLRRYVRSLELYDYILRHRTGLPLDAPVARKLPIYLVNNRAGLVAINPATRPDVRGIYFPREEDIFSTAINDGEMDYLLHEYFHHFSFQMGSTGNYPGWLIEGLAEYYMTAGITDDSVRIGGFNENRTDWLMNSTWLSLEDLLSKRPGGLPSGNDRNTYYPVAWLLTHWFMSDNTRRAQLEAYIAQVRGGGDPVAAMQVATGMTLPALTQELRRYMRGLLPVTQYEINRPAPGIVVTSLPASADDLLLIGQRLKIGVKTEDRAETAALVRRLAARYPDDSFAMLQLGHAELHFGDPVAGEAVLTRLLEREPDNIEALQLMAVRCMTLAEEGPDEVALRARARAFLARAYNADPGQYYTLQLLARNRQSQPGYPNENDLTTWSLAFDIAPQLSSTRLGYSSALMQAGEFDLAVRLLEPLANSPHGGSASDAAQKLLERAQAGQPPLTDEELEAATEADQPSQPEPQPAPADGGPTTTP